MRASVREAAYSRLPFDPKQVPSPAYVIDEGKLKQNLELLRQLRQDTGCKILLAQKAFSCYALYPLIGEYLDGVTSSSLHEARLGYEEMGKQVHTFAPAYRPDEFEEILRYSDHIVFNTPSQWKRFRPLVEAADKKVSCGLRVNPECSTQDHAIYDPCAPGSRMGTTAAHLTAADLEGLEGLHFHTLCEQNSDALATTLDAVEEKFGKYLSGMKWLNFGGGHHITRPDYDLETLRRCIRRMQQRYGVEVYLEPGEAVALRAGYLVCTVLERMENHLSIAILDTTAACHMPDVLEMPYRPPLLASGCEGEKPYIYRLGGPTCLAGDIIGDYSFDEPLEVGDQLIFEDMAIYTMVKNNTFNGICLPSILIARENGDLETVKTFGYEDFKRRL